MNVPLPCIPVSADVLSVPYLLLGALPWLILGALAVCIGLAVRSYLNKKKKSK